MTEGNTTDKNTLGRILRIIGIVLFSLTVTFTLLGGVGSTCAALGAEGYDSMKPLLPYKWMYQLLVVITVGIAIYGITVTINLIREKEGAYKGAIITLVLALLAGGVQMIASEILRGASAPTNMRVYFTIFTLGVFLLFRIPGIWEKVGFSQAGDSEGNGTAAGMAMFTAGVLTLTVHNWASPTHTWDGINFVDVWRTQLMVVGWTLLILGVALFAKSVWGITLAKPLKFLDSNTAREVPQ
ncbi:MAG: hypothetical protein PVF74_08845 [Anaerolineales bacterium]|jgi:hypothetical protein